MTEQEAGELTSAGPHGYGSHGAFHPQIHRGYAWLVARDDLAARLDRAAAVMATIVSAPAGGGKTTLLRAWAATPDFDVRASAGRLRSELAGQRGRIIIIVVIDDFRELNSTESVAELRHCHE